MWVYKIVARRNDSAETEPRSQEEAFDGLLGAFRLDGHILGRDLITVSLDRQIEAYVLTPGRDAFEERFRNEWISKRLDQATAAGLHALEFIELGKDPSEPDACACTDRSSFILFTTYLSLQSPVRCGDCFDPVPLYRLPRFKSGEFVEVISWFDDYKACDSLFMNSSTGERFTYREMSQIDSNLSQHGREICLHIEQTTTKPAYYYAFRYYGRSESFEESRKCPGCGEEWKLPEQLYDIFDFKCDKCRLTSCVSPNFR